MAAIWLSLIKFDAHFQNIFKVSFTVLVVRRLTYRCNPLGPNLPTLDMNCKSHVCTYVFMTQGHTEIIENSAAISIFFFFPASTALMALYLICRGLQSNFLFLASFSPGLPVCQLLLTHGFYTAQITQPELLMTQWNRWAVFGLGESTFTTYWPTILRLPFWESPKEITNI